MTEKGKAMRSATVPPLAEWDKLFKEAKKNGFDSRKDAKEFANFNITLSDGIENEKKICHNKHSKPHRHI